MSSPKISQTVKSKLSKKFLSYCKHSTMHGMLYLYKCSSWSMRITWLIIICCCGALTGFLSQRIWEQYVIDPTVTVVESTHHPTSGIAFPAVVLCDSSPVYGPATDHVTDILLRRGYDLATVELFFETISSGKRLLADMYERMRIIHDLLVDIGISLVDLYEMLGKPCDVLLVRCFWRSKEHNCSEMFHKRLNYRGFCCRFDLNFLRAHHGANASHFAAHPGNNKALDLVINGQTVFLNGTIVDASAELFVLDPEDGLTIMDSSVSVASQTFSDVSITVSALHASRDVKALPMNVRRCMLPTDAEAESTFFSGCVSGILVHEIAKHCKCIPFSSNVTSSVEGYGACTWEQGKCMTKIRKSFSGSPAEIMAFQNCFQRCDYVKYDMQVQFFALNRPSPHIDESLEGRGYSEVSIHFVDRSCMKYRREVLFTWDQMLANIGGIYGLCMGGSIISFIEVAWLILELIYICCADRTSKPKKARDQKKANSTVFLVSTGKLDLSLKRQNSTKMNPSGKVFPFTR